MLLVRRADLEQQLEAGRSSLAGVEVRSEPSKGKTKWRTTSCSRPLRPSDCSASSDPSPASARNIAPGLNAAHDELGEIVADMGLDSDRVYLSCYEVAGEGGDKDIAMFFGTPLADDVITAKEPTQLVMLPGVEVASCVRQGTARQVWPRIVNDVMQWIEKHGYEHVGPGRDVFLETNDQDPSKQVFEIQALLRRPGDAVPAVAPRRLRSDRAAPA